jgi:hypothetical protein
MELFLGFILITIVQILDGIEAKAPQNYEELADSMPKAPWNNKGDKSKIRVE